MVVASNQYQTYTVIGSKATQIIYGDKDNPIPGMIVNNDLTDPVIIGDFGVTAGGLDTAPIQPLQAIAYDGTRDIYARTGGVNLTAQVIVMPGITYWAPSPAQAAAQIAALGLALETTQQVNTGHTLTTANNVALVNSTLGLPAQDPSVLGLPGVIALTGAPPLALSQLFVNPGVQTFTTLQSRTYGPGAIGQMAVEVFLSLTSNASETNPYFKVTFQWTESTTGQVVRTEEYYCAGGGSGVANVYTGTLRAKGDTLTVTILNQGTLTSGNCQIAVVQCSRTYTREDLRSDSFVGFPGTPNASPYPVRTNGIFGTSPTVTVATPASRAMPLYVGTVRLTAFTQTGGASIAILMPPTVGLNQNLVFVLTLGTNVTVNAAFDLPRANCTMTITNLGASAQQIGAAIFVSEQDI